MILQTFTAAFEKEEIRGNFLESEGRKPLVLLHVANLTKLFVPNGLNFNFFCVFLV